MNKEDNKELKKKLTDGEEWAAMCAHVNYCLEKDRQQNEEFDKSLASFDAGIVGIGVVLVIVVWLFYLKTLS